MYRNNAKKFVAVCNTKHSIPTIMNALGHSTVGIMHPGGIASDEAHLLSYTNERAGLAALISEYPFIVLSSKNSDQLRGLHERAQALGLAHNVFTTSMVGPSAEEQLARTAQADALDYVVVLLFGEAHELNPLTKKFSLFKAPQPAPVSSATRSAAAAAAVAAPGPGMV